MVHMAHQLRVVIRDAVPLLLHTGHGLLKAQVLGFQELAILLKRPSKRYAIIKGQGGSRGAHTSV